MLISYAKKVLLQDSSLYDLLESVLAPKPFSDFLLLLMHCSSKGTADKESENLPGERSGCHHLGCVVVRLIADG